MKVCTDACIFGAWFAAKNLSFKTALDIGAGSGLLTLMLAQKTTGEIHAIEKDLSSFNQLELNVDKSMWGSRINAFAGDVTSYPFPTKYDFIICNPPFYQNDLKSRNNEKNLAKHDDGLTLAALTEVIAKNLSSDGSCGILLPYHRMQEYETLVATEGFHLLEKLLVKQTPNHGYFRSILHFARRKVKSPLVHELIIRDNGSQYSTLFTALLKDYYLHL
ncbi:MAG TPA: methyltransferase [Agriterribacter sp.]|nr:methyltransferase [Agriterribacter sp.]